MYGLVFQGLLLEFHLWRLFKGCRCHLHAMRVKVSAITLGDEADAATNLGPPPARPVVLLYLHHLKIDRVYMLEN